MNTAPPATGATQFPHYAIAKDHTGRIQRLIELKLRQFEGENISQVKAHDLSDLMKAIKLETKAAKCLDVSA